MPEFTVEAVAQALHSVAACQHWESVVRPKGRTDECPNMERHRFEARAVIAALMEDLTDDTSLPGSFPA